MFNEICRNSDPAGSHQRALDLTKSPELTRRMLEVLKIIQMAPNQTARDLGRLMYNRSGQTDDIEVPHKVLKRLTDAGWVKRTLHGRNLRCKITLEGLRVLNSRI